MKALLSIAGLLVLAYGALCLAVFLFQAKLVYFPSRTLDASPQALGLAYEDVWFEAKDGVRLHAWFVPAAEARGVLLYCHGNGGNISHRLDPIHAFHELGLAVLAFDYRGYGRSDGTPDEAGLYLDGRAAWKHVVEERGFAPEQVVAFGESLGGGVAIDLVREKGAGVLLTEAAFTSIPDVGAEVYSWLPVRLLSRHHFDNHKKARDVRVPWLIMHSRDDEIVPFDHALELFDVASEPRLLLPTDGGHNDGGYLRRAEWRHVVRDFLAAHL